MSSRIVIDSLRHPDHLYTRSEVLARPSPVPRKPGVYGWFFCQAPPGVPTDNCVTVDSCVLLYAGIAPKCPPRGGGRSSEQSLWNRIRYHMRGSVGGSTLRLTLACLLADTLGLRLGLRASGDRMTLGPEESTLSHWLDSNARVAWVVHEAPWEPEPEVVRELSLPLNLEHNTGHPYYQQLKLMRAHARKRAQTPRIADR